MTLRLPAATAFRITTRRLQVVSMRFVEKGATGKPRAFEVAPGDGVVVSVSLGGTDVRLTFSAANSTLCGLAAPHTT